jgi:hypothetical protein
MTRTLVSAVVAGLDPATERGRAPNASGSDLWMLGSSSERDDSVIHPPAAAH